MLGSCSNVENVKTIKTKDKKQFYGKNIYAQPVFVKNQGINDGDLKFVKITDYNKNTLFGTIKD